MEYKSVIAVKKLKKSSSVKTIGIIKNIEVLKTKKNDDFIVFTIKDNSDEINCILFNTKDTNFKINDNVIIEGKFSFYYENINISDIKLYKKIEKEEEMSDSDVLYIKNVVLNIKDNFFKKYIMIYINDILNKSNVSLKDIEFIKNSFEYILNIKNISFYKNINIDLLLISIILNYNKNTFDIEIKNKKIEKINNIIYINDFNIFENNILFISKTLNNLNNFLNYFLLELEENNKLLKTKINENIEKLNIEKLKLNIEKDIKQIEYFNNEINNMYLDIKKVDEEKEKILVKKQMHIHKILKMCMLLQINNDDDINLNNEQTFIECNIIKNIKNILN